MMLMCADGLEEGSLHIGDLGGPLVTENNNVSNQLPLLYNSPAMISGILYNMKKRVAMLM